MADPVTTAADEVREEVRRRYAAAARAAPVPESAGCCGTQADEESSCCEPGVALRDASGAQIFGGALYDDAEASGAPDTAVAASLGALGAVSDVLGVCVIDDAGVDAVLRGPDGALGAMTEGSVVVVHSTVHPTTCLRLQEDFPALHVIDAPVSGGGHKAAAGALVREPFIFQFPITSERRIAIPQNNQTAYDIA